jgi:hypothetical protein
MSSKVILGMIQSAVKVGTGACHDNAFTSHVVSSVSHERYMAQSSQCWERQLALMFP